MREDEEFFIQHDILDKMGATTLLFFMTRLLFIETTVICVFYF